VYGSLRAFLPKSGIGHEWQSQPKNNVSCHELRLFLSQPFLEVKDESEADTNSKSNPFFVGFVVVASAYAAPPCRLGIIFDLKMV
jgi:hypothetical protein